MIELAHAKSASALLRGLDSLLVVAPRAAFEKRGFLADALPEPLRRATKDAADATEPGDLGDVTRARTGDAPAELAVAVLPDRVGRHNSPTRAESIRRVASKAALGRPGKRGVLVVVEDEEHALAAAAAVARALPLFSLKSGKRAKSAVRLMVAKPDGTAIPADATVREVCAAVREAARLVDTPPTDMNPAAMAAEARRMLRGIDGVRVREIKGDALLQAGLRGVHAVGRTAVEAPRVVVATWTPKQKGKGRPKVALVGKGVTYDTGGLHLKARGSMETMKSDMGGAAAVLGAFRVVAATKVPVPVTLVLCLAENAIGPRAYKPDDVLEMHSGKTVEINNTDAEGRLLLADGVSYAARELGAEIVLDAATLTGAQLIATGEVHAAVMSNDDDLEQRLVASGRRTGDLLHPLPFAPELYRQEFASPIADMRNSVKNRSNAQSSCAAEFVHWHLDGTDVRWAHVDLAGPAFRNDRGTGFGVALLADLMRAL